MSPEMNPEVLLLLHHQPAHRPVAGDFTATAVTFAAMALFDHLDGEKRQRVVVPMDDENRCDWIFFPESGRRGVPLRDLDRTQLYLAHRLITQSMSVEGYAQVVQAMSLESILRELEHPARVQPTGLRARGFAPRVYPRPGERIVARRARVGQAGRRHRRRRPLRAARRTVEQVQA